MKPLAYCLFDTPFGSCGIAWREPGSAGALPAVGLFQLPEATPAVTESVIAGRAGAAEASLPPPAMAALIEKIQRHFRGDLQDFSEVPVEPGGAGPFARAVYAATQAIPAGDTRTYGELARILGRSSAARAVGHALGRNPIPIIIPCHRVLAADGQLRGFSAHGGIATKANLLRIEGVFVGVTGVCTAGRK
ncbi:MAG: methylated-DNA--[protein]-cysteine S-methyltransferase [Methylococcus sp.]|nr:methylated-DNA--[protein]-cysteine S-methyltransferase [Methylococcus sp.]